jgi:polyphosphate glucokinase
VATKAVGIDIGGTGIKGAIVDVDSGELLTDRIKKPTPEGGEPDDIVAVVKSIVDELGEESKDLHVGVCFPAAIMDGKTLSAANVSKAWIGFEAEALFEKTLGRPIHFVNDADAAGYAEAKYGAAKGIPGLVIMTTLGTGIGTALINDGVLIVNAELGHLEIEGKDYETKASFAAKERDDLSWKHWARRLQKYYSRLEALLYPRLIVVGGGVSKQYQEFLPLLDLRAEVVPAKLRNNAGIMGAAALASESKPSF